MPVHLLRLTLSETNYYSSDHEQASDSMQQNDTNAEGVLANGQLTAKGTSIDTSGIGSAALDPNPAGPTPVDDVSGGIQPVADLLPKDASNLSHPTPPPDEPLTTGAADVDVEMGDAESEAQPPAQPEPVAQSEQSLVRPREDDGEDEPAAKRSKVEEETQPDVDAPATLVQDPSHVDEVAATATESVPEPVTEPSAEVIVDTSVEAPVETEPAVEVAVEPPTDPSTDVKVEATQPETQPNTQPETQPSDAPLDSVEQSDSVAAVQETPVDQRSADAEATVTAQPQSEADSAPTAQPEYSTDPMTAAQKSSLIEKMKNLKKTKNSVAFLKPVDPIALNIPSYVETVTNPMDLSTMETKLKEGQYSSVKQFADDFDLIIGNVRRFNGDAHAVTQQGMAMEAYFRRMMQTVPTADMAAPSKVPKKRSPSIPRDKPRRESRAAAAPAAVPATADVPYALQADGTPQIRRQSTLNSRPARAIKPPQNREIPYAKPKRKEHQLELKFSEQVLEEIRGAKFTPLNHVFMTPVDPVALNIPHYRQVIKNPMDLGTMWMKLKSGQYGTAGEVKKDFDLLIKNCLTFNPTGNPVRDLGIQLQREFEALWAGKEKWERKNQPASNRASSASADDESPAEEDDEDDDDPEEDNAATIRALQKKLLDMQSALTGLAGDKKSKKPKSGKATKKIGSLSAAPAKPKAAPKAGPKAKKVKQVTYDEKQEISEAVAKMDDKQVGTLTEIITKNCAKYRDMEEMELEIDDLPNDVQAMLLDYVRRIFGNPNKKKAREASPDDAAALDDDDYLQPERGARGGKRKKHKPMGKKKQQDTIDSIRNKLAQFSQAGTSGSESPTTSSFNVANAQADTSGDDESEESEEE